MGVKLSVKSVKSARMLEIYETNIRKNIKKTWSGEKKICEGKDKGIYERKYDTGNLKFSTDPVWFSDLFRPTQDHLTNIISDIFLYNSTIKEFFCLVSGVLKYPEIDSFHFWKYLTKRKCIYHQLFFFILFYF